MKSIFQKTKFLTLKVHEIKTTDQNLFKSSRNIKRYILIICKKFQGLSIFPNRNMNKKVCSKRCFPSTFVYSCFFEKIQFLQCLLSSVAPWLYDSTVDTKWKMFEIQVCRLLENEFFSDFSRKFGVYTYIQVFYICVCKCLNQRVRIGKKNGKSFKGVSKTKEEKKTHEKIQFHNSIQD